MHKKKRARLDDVPESGEPVKKICYPTKPGSKELRYFFESLCLNFCTVFINDL